jgi:hypothetical protein
MIRNNLEEVVLARNKNKNFTFSKKSMIYGRYFSMNRSGLKKVYKAIQPLISVKKQGQKSLQRNQEKAARMLAQAYWEYSQNLANIFRDIQNQYTWPYVYNAGKYCIYDPADPDSQDSQRYIFMILQDIQSFTAPR